MNHTIENGRLKLEGRDMVCPFRSPILVPGQVGMSIVNSTCSVVCPLFELQQSAKKGKAVLHCSLRNIDVDIISKFTEEKKALEIFKPS